MNLIELKDKYANKFYKKRTIKKKLNSQIKNKKNNYSKIWRGKFSNINHQSYTRI